MDDKIVNKKMDTVHILNKGISKNPCRQEELVSVSPAKMHLTRRLRVKPDCVRKESACRRHASLGRKNEKIFHPACRRYATYLQKRVAYLRHAILFVNIFSTERGIPTACNLLAGADLQSVPIDYSVFHLWGTDYKSAPAAKNGVFRNPIIIKQEILKKWKYNY
jgi:hypothetical protein